MSPHNNLCTQHLHRMVLTFSQQSPDIGPWLGQYPSWKMIKNQEAQSKIIFAAFSSVFWDPYRDMNNRTGDMKTRKPFGNHSDYVQITFNCVQLAQKLRNFYVKNQVFFWWFLGVSIFYQNPWFQTKKKGNLKIPEPLFISIGWSTPAITCFWRLHRLTVAWPIRWALDI